MKSAVLLIAVVGLASCATQAPASVSGSPAPAATAKKKEPEPKPYPLETCLVTGDDLDEMDERVSTVYEGQTFEFCCKPCLKKFRKNPGKYKKALERNCTGKPAALSRSCESAAELDLPHSRRRADGKSHLGPNGLLVELPRDISPVDAPPVPAFAAAGGGLAGSLERHCGGFLSRPIAKSSCRNSA